MNDFTKDELEELMHCVYAYRDLCDEDVEDNLCDKLKSIIDNYDKPCGHINCRRVSLLDGHAYDICPNCDYIWMIR